MARPHVFVSSVFDGLEGMRYAAYRVLDNRAWDAVVVPAPPVTSRWSSADLRRWCIEAVAKSDLFIGIYWQRYGTALPGAIAGVAWTELEFRTAYANDTPCYLYYMDPPSGRVSEQYLRHLSMMAEVASASPNVHVRRLAERSFRSALEWDLDEFGASFGGVVSSDLSLTPPLRRGMASEPASTSAIEHVVSEMRAEYRRGHYAGSIATGVEALDLLCARRVDRQVEQLWLRFLPEWERAGAWTDLDRASSRQFSTQWAAEQRARIHLRRGETLEYYRAAGSVASAHHRAGRYRVALDWLDMAGRAESGAPSAAHLSMRASMLARLDRHEEAKAAVMQALDKWLRTGPDESVGKDLAKLGVLEAAAGNFGGLKRIEAALALVAGDKHAGFRGQTLAMAVEAALTLGDACAADEFAREFDRHCRRFGLRHQLREAQKRRMARTGGPIVGCR